MKNRNLNNSDNWKTPNDLYTALNQKYRFNYDPCPYSEGEPLFNGLETEWGTSNFINPPYSRELKEAFIMKAIEESKKGKRCVMLLPVSTSTKIFHEQILPNANEIYFVKGRISFEEINTKGQKVSKGSKPMHDSMIVVFGPFKDGVFAIGGMSAQGKIL